MSTWVLVCFVLGATAFPRFINEEFALYSDVDEGSLTPSVMDPYPDLLLQEDNPEVTVGQPEAAPNGNANIQKSDPENVLLKVWYINLDDHKERRQIQEAAAAKSSVPFERWPAVRLSSVQDVLDNAGMREHLIHAPSFSPAYKSLNPNIPPKELTKKEKFVLSVCMSHLTLLDQAEREFGGKQGYFMVVEDDVILSEGFEVKLSELMAHAPSDWEIVRLSVWGTSREDDRVGDSMFYRATQPFFDGKTFYYGGAHGVLFRLSKLRAVLDTLTHKIEFTDIDSMYTNHPALKSYAVPAPMSWDVVAIAETKDQSHPPDLALGDMDAEELERQEEKKSAIQAIMNSIFGTAAMNTNFAPGTTPLDVGVESSGKDNK